MDYKQALSTSREYLCDNLVVDNVLDGLVSKKVIGERMKQTIEAQPENFKKVRKLVDIMLTLPYERFSRFLDVCRENDYDHVADELLSKTNALFNGYQSPMKQEEY